MILRDHFDPDLLFALAGRPAAGPDSPPGDATGIDELEPAFQLATEDGSLGLGPGPLWRAFKTEMHLLICTQDPKYAALREAIAQQTARSQMPVVSAIAVFVGSEIGVAAGVLTPFCALFLAWALKVGQETTCRAAAG